MRQNRAQFKTFKNGQFPDNNTGLIDAKKPRDVEENVADSAVWWPDDIVTNLSSPNDTTVPTSKAVSDAVYTGSTHERGDWSTTDALPSNGSGTAGAVVKFDRWIVETSWTYQGVYHSKWTFVIAMVDGASTYDNFKIIL